MGPLLALVVAASAGPSPSNQTLLFYNGRAALREGHPTEALKLWLLRNVVANVEGHVGAHDRDFGSVTWAALGSQGLCPDGLPQDDAGGAGLWPLATHNQVVLSLVKGPVSSPQNPADAFEVQRQQRFISMNDVLDPAELRTVSFFRTACVQADVTMLTLGRSLAVDPTDRLATAPVMRLLLQHALRTLDRSKVESVAAVEARIFDLDLSIIELMERRARRAAIAARQTGRRAGLSDEAATENADQVRRWPANSSQAAFLTRSLSWTTNDWMSLSPQRRLFLFAQARPLATSAAAVQPLVLGLIDAQLDRGGGDELQTWLGHLELADAPAGRSVVTGGERGKRLLGLEPTSGFRERAVIALHRGVAALESGERLEALRSFGFAMAHAEESSEATAVQALSRRWLSYVLSRYQTDDEVLGTLRALVPRQDYNAIVEDLIWRAALRADEKSFDLVTSTVQHGGALDARIARLRLLARGDAGGLATQLREGAVDEPHLTLRFARLLLEKVEAEDADVRLANVPMLKLLSKVLESISANTVGAKSQLRTAEELIGRTQGILEGLSHFDTSPAGRARALDVRHETFAGNIRLAPADPLPWPFAAPTAAAASVFVPLKLVPLEWRDERGELVFGWRITE